MAIASVDLTLFKGFFKLPNANPADQDVIIDYLDPSQVEFVTELVGQVAALTIQNQDPLQGKYNDLLNGSTYFNDVLEGEVKQRGIYQAIIGLLYFRYARDNFNASDSGHVQQKQEVARNVQQQNNSIVAQRWNASVKYLCEEIAPFVFQFMSQDATVQSSVFTAPNTWLLNVDNTQYLYDGDTVRINSIDYTVANVAAGSFEIQAEASADFDGLKPIWKPFDDFPIFLKIPYIYNEDMKGVYSLFYNNYNYGYSRAKNYYKNFKTFDFVY